MKTLLCIAALSLAGCSSFQTIEQERQIAASGLIGCEPAAIGISDNARYTWTATCRGKVFQCTVAPHAACSPRLN